MDLKKANQLLIDEDCSCIILKGEDFICSSHYIGVKPLLGFIKGSPINIEGAKLSLIDKVIGRAAALLAAKIGIKRIFTPILSSEALPILDHYGIEYNYLELVPYIINRKGDDRCPIEKSVLNTIDIEEGYKNILATVADLMNPKGKN